MRTEINEKEKRFDTLQSSRKIMEVFKNSQFQNGNLICIWKCVSCGAVKFNEFQLKRKFLLQIARIVHINNAHKHKKYGVLLYHEKSFAEDMIRIHK